MEFLNDSRWQHICSNGTEFTCDRCDFKEPVIINPPDNLSPENLWQDLSEMIGYHALNVWPNLNGFQGYDTITFKVVKK